MDDIQQAKGRERIALLRRGDLPRVLDLTALAGWNQTLADLERMLQVAPESAFGLWRDGQLVSTAMAFSYGAELGWIAMVLTHRDARGKGFASQLTRQAVDWLRARGTHWVKLDASHLGQPVYERMGFVTEGRMERFLRPAELAGHGERQAALEQEPAHADIPYALDRAAFGADRSHLLRLLLRVPGLRVAVLPEGAGYAMLRPGAKARQLGPMVCRDLAAAQRLLQWALHASQSNPLQWDVHTANADAVQLATANGFAVQRVLARMALAGQPQPALFRQQTHQVFAIAGFDFG